MISLYPIIFETQYKEKIWGGQKINTVLKKDFSPLLNCGETWEISGVDGNISKVKEGPLSGKELIELIDTYKGDLVGHKIYERFGNEFPLLVKFIDANADLSIQVHPNDDMAQKRHNGFGKTEMWYVIQADDDATLISGFNKDTSKEEYLEKLDNHKLYDILNRENVKADDVFFIPAGRVHTIGKGILLAEIQQTSDITYRIYDFDRVDAQGNKRELHTKEAIDAIDYNHYDQYKTTYTKKKNDSISLVSCPYFTTNSFYIDQTYTANYQDLDSFVIYVCLDGEALLSYDGIEYNIKKGDSMLLPACTTTITITPKKECKMLESYIE